MEVSNPNNVKIYNLSTGKSLPDWLSERKKRALTRSDINIRNKIELLQDFEMPILSERIQISQDGRYILATGTYKPRVRCYEVGNLSMKFERCLDADIVKFQLLCEDYTKIAFLLCDRYVEFHAKYGKYYRTRIPKFGRDLAYHNSTCDLYFVAASSEIYRLNLERGQFLNSIETDSNSYNVCKFNPVHDLFVCGSDDGRVQAFDPRCRSKVGSLDCALNSVTDDTEVNGVPAVTSLAFKDGLNLAVGTATGQILLYDIRSNKPLLVKDHMYGLPIKNVEFHTLSDVMVSMDSKIIKIWNRHTGKAFTSIESTTILNDLCLVPDSGLMFLANDAVKMQSYYIPTLGPAPRWCSFLDSLTEELEENTSNTIYDDYKFLTSKELEDFGLSHLIGSNLLRAYMHGYFIDMRLYHKAKAIAEPFAFDDYRKEKIKEKMAEECENRVKIHKLPSVNKDLAEKLMMRGSKRMNKKNKSRQMLFGDDRFKVMFENPDFQIDSSHEEYRLKNPFVEKLDQKEAEKQKLVEEQFEMIESGSDRRWSSDDSSDDEHTWSKEVKETVKEKKTDVRFAQKEVKGNVVQNKPKFLALKRGIEYGGVNNFKPKKIIKSSLGDRINSEDVVQVTRNSSGKRELTFTLKKSKRESSASKAMERHRRERHEIARSARSIQMKLPKTTWMGRRKT